MTTAAPTVLEFEHVTKTYDGRAVVDDLSFRVEPGCVTGFLGPNGSGKSTTMKILLGLAAADRGVATIGGRRYRDLDAPADTVGVMIEPNAFHPGRSGRNHLRIVAEAAGHSLSEVDGALAAVGLDGDPADRRVGTYSLGMKQRLSLACALIGDPPVLVLDEPANGLDPQGIREMRDVLRGRAARGDTVLVSSHLLAEMQHLVDEVIVINQGRLVMSGGIDELTEGRAVVRSPDCERLAACLVDAGADVEVTGIDALAVTGLGLAAIGDTAHAAGCALHELSADTGSLEGTFLSLTSSVEEDPHDHLEQLEHLEQLDAPNQQEDQS